MEPLTLEQLNALYKNRLKGTLRQHGRNWRVRWGDQPIEIEGVDNEFDAFCRLMQMAAKQCDDLDERLGTGPITVNDHIDIYLDEIHHLRILSESRRKSIPSMLRNVKAMSIGKRPALAITKTDIDSIKVERPMKTGTHRGYAFAIKQAINEVRTRNGQPAITWAGMFKMPKRGKALQLEYRKADIGRIMIGMDNELVAGEVPHPSGRSHLGILARLAYLTGQRIEALMKAQWMHVGTGPGERMVIYFDDARDTDDTSKEAAVIPVNHEIQQVLGWADGRSQRLIWGGDGITYKVARTRLNKVVHALGYRRQTKGTDKESWHTFRHSRVMHLHRDGFSDARIAAMLNDTVDVIRSHYMHADKIEDLGDAFDAHDSGVEL